MGIHNSRPPRPSLPAAYLAVAMGITGAVRPFVRRAPGYNSLSGAFHLLLHLVRKHSSTHCKLRCQNDESHNVTFLGWPFLISCCLILLIVWPPPQSFATIRFVFCVSSRSFGLLDASGSSAVMVMAALQSTQGDSSANNIETGISVVGESKARYESYGGGSGSTCWGESVLLFPTPITLTPCLCLQLVCQKFSAVDEMCLVEFDPFLSLWLYLPEEKKHECLVV